MPTRTTAAGARRPGLRAHLVALVLAVLLPSLALGAATAWRMAANYRAAFEERLSDTAQALALALDREVQAHAAALAALAASPHLDVGRHRTAAAWSPPVRGASGLSASADPIDNSRDRAGSGAGGTAFGASRRGRTP